MKMKLICGKKVLLPFLLFYVSALSYGQGSFSAYDMLNGFATYWPASVSASQLFRKPAEKIDYATGRATIHIPLYEIRTADFVLPISISFVTGGQLQDQLAGQMGLGWQLEAEPMITRQIRGMPDEFYFLTDSLVHNKHNDEYYPLRYVTGQADFQQDIFNFRLLSGSSTFILGESANRYFHPRLLTQEGTKVTVPGGRVSSNFSNPIHITDRSGNRYVFGGENSARELTYQGNGESVTSWKASEIVSPGGDCINFSYLDAAPLEYPSSRYDFYMVEDNYPELDPSDDIPPHPGYWVGVNGKKNYYYMSSTEPGPTSGTLKPVFKKWTRVNDVLYANPGSRVRPRPIQRIDFAGGSVRFSYSADNKLLEKMDVYSGSQLLRSVRFTMSATFLPFLTKVEMLGSDGKSSGCYHLKYDSYFGDRSPYSQGDLVPLQHLSVNRPSDHQACTFSLGAAGNPYFPRYREGDLRSVTYPSGGRTEYNYEYGFVHPPIGSLTYSETGLLRLSSIVEHPVCGIPVSRQFKYGDSKTLNGIGYTRFPVDGSAFTKEYRKHYISQFLGRYSATSGRARVYCNQNQLSGERLVYYPFVQETVNGVSTLHHFPCYSSFEQGVTPRFPDPIGYGQFLSMEDSCNHSSGGQSISAQKVSQRYGRNMVSELITTGIFENAGNLYDAAYQSLSIRELCMSSYYEESVEVIQQRSGEDSRNDENLNGSGIASRNEIRTYSSTSPDQLLSISTDRERVEFSYPDNNPSKAAHARMKANNELDTPVETRHYVDGVLRKRLVYDFQLDSKATRGYSLSAVSESTDASGGSLRVAEQYHNYLRCGRPSQVTRQDGSVVAIVWGYGGLHPIAFVEGMTANALSAAGISLEQAAASHTISESVYTLLNSLRGTHPEARVTTYRYKPMVGVVQRTDPDGSSETYSYDASGRLSETKNNHQKTKATYEYHEANQ